MSKANLTTEREFVAFVESIKKSLICSDYDFSESCSICMVPRGLKKWNEDAYMPRVVSIGPRFKGSTEDLLLMEEVKQRCMMSLLHRGIRDADECLEKCSEAIWKLDDVVRESYLPDIKVEKLEKPELAEIMLVDGCFLLELLISKGLDSQLRSRRRGRPAAEMINNDNVLSDLMLFENQIPTFVLHELFRTIFPLFAPDGDKVWIVKKINNLVLSLLGYSPHQLRYHKAPHILDLVHFYVNSSTGDITSTPSQQEDHVVIDNIDTTQTQQQELKLKRCALRLLTAGVTIKVKLPQDIDSNEFGTLSCFSLVWNSFFLVKGVLFWLGNIFVVKGKHMDNIPEAKGLEFYFKFENRKLEIGQLHITQKTKAKWCNLIAWEHHLKIQSINNQGTRSSLGGNGISTSAALIFNSLICSEDDVQFLKDNKIVVDHTKMSNQNLVDFFRKIAFGVDHTVVDDSYYTQMVNEINNFSKAFFIIRILSTVWNSFKYHKEWLLKFLNHNYNFIATVISLCTVVQTIYAIIAYQLPKK